MHLLVVLLRIAGLIIICTETKVNQESAKLKKCPPELTKERLEDVMGKLRSLSQLCLTGASV